MWSSLIFIVLLATISYFGYRSFYQIYRNIHLGKPEKIEGNFAERIKNVLLIAFGQKKMFKNYLPAVLHFFIYAAFLLTQIELIEIIIDGIFSTHRFFAASLGGFYTFLISFIEILSVGAFVATVAFLWRRNILKVPRLSMNELNGWPKLDANYILLGEILLLIGIFSMNSADGILQQRLPEHYPPTGTLPVSSVLGQLFLQESTDASLIMIERFGWWLHVLVVFGFILYLPLSKHLHIFLSFPNVYYANLKSRGEMANMPEIMNEVRSMLGLTTDNPTDAQEEIPKFGASDVVDLSWKNILDAYSCTECGRCTAACPANSTGKKLSPRKIMMDTRDRATEIGEKIKAGSDTFKQDATKSLDKTNFTDGRSLFDYISKEEVNACTTCNACVEACPVMINPLDIILQLRRYQMLTESSAPEEWTPMFTSLENQGCVWQVPQSRTEWIQH